jgi:GTP-binding protein
MKIEFLKSAGTSEDFPKHRIPEIALAGRSNVGKSSLVNRIAPQKPPARISKKPGCTRTMNFYVVDQRACLVDLPGYGFARVSKSERAGWADLIDEYLEDRDNLSGVVVVMDATIPPTATDLQMLDFASTLDVPVLAVATKFDRIPKAKRIPRMDAFKRGLPTGTKVLAFSAESGEGREDLLFWIAASCGVQRFR